MRATTSAIFLAISLSAVKATVHTVCYNYFLQKDGCVFSAAAADQRCPAPPKEHPAEVQAFALNTTAQKVKRSVNKLERRYDTTAPSFAIGGGNGTCGFYDSVNQLGVCLWNGAEQNNPTIETAGWLNGAKTSNCGKRIYIQRKGQPNTVNSSRCSTAVTSEPRLLIRVVLTLVLLKRKLSFHVVTRPWALLKPTNSPLGQLFNAFNPTPEEQRDGGITWDFDNLHGLSPQQAPV
ncbi:hypothetical protein PSHT_03412 [Puccinia striiformis]|uniref:Secreted protein n=1 Tax=Puccinia striiformis TaxID=27350 RepID=A0A2S4WFM9_9BASI|nr:hypothetical protein PSHT_03412 [Puccinia striiformis]